jgi:predicted AlkP superfamily phosphohydrolase/phosphomutase
MTSDLTPTVVLGFDGLAFRYLDDFDLPNFERLRDRGVEAPLSSTHPPWTASAWPSMYTGQAPDHHGVYSFFDFGDGYPDEADVVTRNDVRAPALWNYLASRDLPVVVCNLPVTHPAEPVEGVLIPGYLAPGDAPGTPEGVREEVSDAIGEPYRIYAEAELADDPEAKLDGYVDLVRMRARAAEHLLDAHEWALAVVQVQKTDAVFHNFDDPAAWERVYAAADDLLGRVLDVVDDDANVVVCSDHGMRHRDGYVVHVNEVLREAGLLQATSGGGGGPSLRDRKHRMMATGDGEARGDAGAPSLAARTVSRLAAASRAVGVSPGAVYRVLDRAGLGRPLLELLPAGASVSEQVDWRGSDAYCRLGTEMGVRVNRQGREPAGTVPPDDYEAVRDRVVDVLGDLETPDGDPAFEFVEPREAVYDGPRADAAPDVVFRPNGMNHGVVGSLVGRRFIPTDNHNHDVDGVFVGAGPAFAADAAPDRLSLVDVAPVAMAAAGLAVPGRMTGRVPEGLLRGTAARTDYGDVPFGTSDPGASDDQVTERLEDLGYL